MSLYPRSTPTNQLLLVIRGQGLLLALSDELIRGCARVRAEFDDYLTGAAVAADSSAVRRQSLREW